MKNLIAIDPPHIDRYRQIVRKKNVPEVKARLQEVDQAIGERYSDFENIVAKRKIQSFTATNSWKAISDELRSCYGTKTNGRDAILSGIKSAQRARQLEKCPYCGITLPTTHDHYLPAGRFPELSVHGLNLVPCCSSCNEIKGERWISDGRRLFIHYYSDKIPDTPFLMTELMVTPDKTSLGARFSIIEPNGIDPESWSIISSHFGRLDLLGRYQNAANDEISNAIDACVDHLCDGGSSAVNFLVRMEQRVAAIFGNSHWRASLYRALAGNDTFIDIVESKAAKDAGGK